MQTPKEKAVSCKTLLCFLQSLAGERCDFELKNDLQLTGKLIAVDSGMNVELANVVMRRPASVRLDDFTIERYDYLYLKGEKIRYVQFSDQIDVGQRIEKRLDEYRRRRQQIVANETIVHQHKKRRSDRTMDRLFKKQEEGSSAK